MNFNLGICGEMKMREVENTPDCDNHTGGNKLQKSICEMRLRVDIILNVSWNGDIRRKVSKGKYISVRDTIFLKDLDSKMFKVIITTFY